MDTKEAAAALLYEKPACAKRLLESKKLEAKAAATLVAEARLALRSASQKEQELLATIPRAETAKQRLTPAVEWAQSPEDLYLRVKWAHKLDAPATLDVGAPTVRCDATRLAVSAASDAKSFDLSLDLTAAVTECAWDAAATGRITISARKVNSAMWAKLTEAKPPALHVWFDKQDELNQRDAAAKRDFPEKNASAAEKPSRKSARRPFFLLDEREPVGFWLANLRSVVANLLDGWTGSPADFAARQAERAIARTRRNATRHVHLLNQRAADAKQALNLQLHANISKLEEETPSSRNAEF